jgi:hypothetical protein
MNNISMNQVLSIWSELWQAYYGKNGFGGDTAEIYAYRLMPYSPSLHMTGETFKESNDELRINAVNSLVTLCNKFAKDNDCTIKIDNLPSDRWISVIGREFDHRCHVKVIHNGMENK